MPGGTVRTYLFADLRDYTLFVERRGDTAAARLLRAYRRLVRAQVALRRGAEVHTEGDSFYVVFRTPGDAIRCALGIVRGARRHNTTHPELPLQIGIGINTGEAVAHGGGYVGSAVIVASRLAQQARPGQILVTDTVRALTRTAGLASVRELGAWRLKGVAEGIRVCEIEVESAGARRDIGPALRLPAVLLPAPTQGAVGLVVCPELVQRERPLAALLEHLRAAATGETRIVALSGEGGIGKSRLCRELARLAYDDGFYVFGGRSYGPSDAPYEPFNAALRPFAQARGNDVLRRLLGGLVSELRRLLPEVDLGVKPADGVSPEEERRDRFVRTIQLLLEDAASLRPVLLVFEDFHHADAASRDLLRHLATTMRGGVCLVFTFREEEAVPSHPLRELTSELERERRLAVIALNPLDVDGVTRMTRALLSERATAPLARVLFERSEGVPFYVEELLKTALDDPSSNVDALALPRTVRDSVQLRVARLTAERGSAVAELLEAVALTGVPLAYDALLRLSGRSEPGAAADVSACIEAQLFERAPTPREIYRFRHALTREAVESAVPPARRRRLHALIARTLEGTVDPDEHAALLMRHFAAAGDGERAIYYARRSAAHAVRVGAYAAAADSLAEAAHLARGTADEASLLQERAAALQAAGRAAEAEADLAKARERAAARGDWKAVAHHDTRLANVLWMQGRRIEAVAAAKRAVASLEAAPDQSLAEALSTLAAIAWSDNDAEEAAHLARRALEIAQRHDATQVVVAALTVLGAAELRLDQTEGAGHLREAIRLGREHDLSAESVNAYLELARSEQNRGNWEPARAAAEAGLALARERGLEFAQVRLLSRLSAIYVTRGRYREARAVAEQAAALARPDTIAATTAKLELAHIMDMQGEHAAAVALFDEIAPQMEGNDPDRRADFLSRRARALAGVGRLEEARGAARSAVELALSIPGMGTSAFLSAADVAEARRDATDVHVLLGALDEYASRRSTPFVRVLRMEMQAILDACEGRDAAEAFTAVADAYAEMGVVMRAAYRRATGAIARLAFPKTRPAARRELIAIRRDLVERGALRYAAIIDSALQRKASTRAGSAPVRRPGALVAPGSGDQKSM